MGEFTCKTCNLCVVGPPFLSSIQLGRPNLLLLLFNYYGSNMGGTVNIGGLEIHALKLKGFALVYLQNWKTLVENW